MSIEFKYRCETCGEVFSESSEVESHLLLEGNADHIIDEEYIKEGASGIPKQIILRSPSGIKFSVAVDDNGVLTTEVVE